jgi:nitroreductase
MTMHQAAHTAPAGTGMDVFAAIRHRRSAARFAPDRPPRALIEHILDAARWAPNHHLTEPWRFIVLAGDARRELADAMATELLEAAAPGTRVEAEVTGLRAKLLRAPVIVVVAQSGRPDDPVRDLEDFAACACATQNLLLAAHASGLAAKWSTGAAAASPAAKRFLGLDPADRLVAYVYLGYPAEEARDSRRRPAADVTRWLGWHGTPVS